jgi:hypothetical protein
MHCLTKWCSTGCGGPAFRTVGGGLSHKFRNVNVARVVEFSTESIFARGVRMIPLRSGLSSRRVNA